MGITLFLMSKKGLSVLKALINSSYTDMIEAVVVGADKNVIKDYSEDITKLCKKENIRFYNRKDDFKVQSQYSIAVSWRWLIKLPEPNKIIVLHDSLLPKYRGFAPLVNALKHEEKHIGVTALFASEEYDRGEVINQQKVSISYPITIKEAITKVSTLYEGLVLEIFKTIKDNNVIKSTPQDETKATYSLWLDDEDYKIDWSKEASYLERFVNATGYPYNGAQTFINGKSITLTSVREVQDVKIENRDIGKTIFLKDGKPVVVCGKGLLLIESANYNETGESILPLSTFRNRFS